MTFACTHNRDTVPLKFGSSVLRNHRYLGQALDRPVVECVMCSPCLFELRLHLYFPFIGYHRASRTFLHVFVSLFCQRFLYFVFFQCLCKSFILLLSSLFYPESMFIVHVHEFDATPTSQLTELKVMVLAARAPTSFSGFSPTRPTEREMATCFPESGRLQTNDLGEGQVTVRFASTERRQVREAMKLCT